MRCACSNKSCENQIFIGDGNIWIKHVNSGNDLLIYVDPNSLVELIKDLRKLLLDKTND